MRKDDAVLRAAALGTGCVALSACAAAAGRPGLGAAAAAASGALIASAFVPRSPLLGPVTASGPRAARRAALTFDDGPGPSTGDVLDALAEAGVRATFFVLGRQARAHPALVARMHAEGHQVANHGWDHGILVFRGPRHVVAQIRRTEQAVADAAGPGVMTPFFRAPHGFRGPSTWPAARAAGYRVTGWSRGVFDSAEPGPDVIAARCRRALAPGAVLLLHDADGWDPARTRRQTAEALPAVCRAAADAGIALVPMDELLGARGPRAVRGVPEAVAA